MIFRNFCKMPMLYKNSLKISFIFCSFFPFSDVLTRVEVAIKNFLNQLLDCQFSDIKL